MCPEWFYPEELIYQKLKTANVKRITELYVSVTSRMQYLANMSHRLQSRVHDRETLMNGMRSNWGLVQNDGKDFSFAALIWICEWGDILGNYAKLKLVGKVLKWNQILMYSFQ